MSSVTKLRKEAVTEKLVGGEILQITRSKTTRLILKPSNCGKNDLFFVVFCQICAVS